MLVKQFLNDFRSLYSSALLGRQSAGSSAYLALRASGPRPEPTAFPVQCRNHLLRLRRRQLFQLVKQLAEFPVFHCVAPRIVPAHGRDSAYRFPCLAATEPFSKVGADGHWGSARNKLYLAQSPQIDGLSIPPPPLAFDPVFGIINPNVVFPDSCNSTNTVPP